MKRPIRYGKQRFGGRGMRLLIAVAIAVGATAGIAYAAIPHSDTAVISGCYGKLTGVLRVVDAQAGKKCTTHETPISWNQRGEPGTEGAPGAPGADGKSGLDGAAGAPGHDGADGISVTSGALKADDENCPFGGSVFTAASGTTYACSGAPGADGRDGADGKDGVAGPRAYARVLGDNFLTVSLDASRTSGNVTAALGASVGAEIDSVSYCFELGFTPNVVFGMEEHDTVPIQATVVQPPGCPASADAGVYRRHSDGPFYVMFH